MICGFQLTKSAVVIISVSCSSQCCALIDVVLLCGFKPFNILPVFHLTVIYICILSLICNRLHFIKEICYIMVLLIPLVCDINFDFIILSCISVQKDK